MKPENYLRALRCAGMAAALVARGSAAQDAPARTPDLAPLLGTWKGVVPGGEAQSLPAVEVVVSAGTGGTPRVELTLFRHVFGPDGRVGKTLREHPAVVRASLVEQDDALPSSLKFRTRDENFRPGPESAPQTIEVDWRLVRQAEDDAAQLEMVWNSLVNPARERGVDVPPPPPPLALKRSSAP